jgi:DNA-binding transcriptional ArsR family regulator
MWRRGGWASALIELDQESALDSRRLPLNALIGRRRAAVLEQAAAGATVSQIARQLRIPQPNASKHLAVLWVAGLLDPIRDRTHDPARSDASWTHPI